MGETVIGGSFVSISHSGTAIFDTKVSSMIGGVEVDLVSAPIPPGEYTMHIETGVGGVEIYLPAYVKFTVDGDATVGGHEVHEGFDFFSKIGRQLTGVLSTNKIPDHAVAAMNPEQEVMIHFQVQRGVGGLDIYRLPVAT